MNAELNSFCRGTQQIAFGIIFRYYLHAPFGG